MTKSDIRLAERRVSGLEKDIRIFQMWFDGEKGEDLKERIIQILRKLTSSILIKVNNIYHGDFL